MSMKQLPPETIKLISSTQVITSVSSVVKELMENSIDAQATVIDIRLENYGLDKIEIRDNGSGISHSDVHVMCLRSYTSKIADVSDLGKLSNYGFRGEALSSICAVANVSVITKPESEKYAKSFTMDSDGRVINSSISHHQKGTVVVIVDIFKKLPVRKQIFSSKKHCVNDLRRVENVVKSLAAIQENVRVSLVHNKSVLWQMASVSDFILRFGQIWSSSMTKYVKHLTFSSEEVKIDLVLPMQNVDIQNCFFTTNLTDAIFLYVNKRPVRNNKIEKLIVTEFSSYFGHYLPPGKYLPCFVSLTVPAETVDVNLEPNKSRVLLLNQEVIMSHLKNCINRHYYNSKVDNDNSENTANPCNKRKISSDSEETVQVKKPVVLMSQIDDSFVPNAESTKIINKSYCDEHEQIIKELSLEDIDFEEPLTPTTEEYNNCERFSQNDEKEHDDIAEYQKKISNIGKTIQLDGANVTNFNSENISISQWSKGDVILNGKPLESGVLVKSEFLNTNLEVNIHPKNEDTNKILQSTIITETCKNNEVINPVDEEHKIAANTLLTPSANNCVRVAPLFRMVSVPDEQVPGLNHLVNRPQSWEHQPRSKRPVQDIPEEDLSETARSVSSQMGNKEMSGFTLFAKEMRVKILQKNPGMDFTKVSKELAKLWGSLCLEEKEKYKQLATEKKKVVTASKTSCNVIRPQKKAFEIIFKDLKRYSTSINVELSDIKRNVFESSIALPPEFKLIGQVQENGWLCAVRNEIRALNIFGLQEAVIFYQKLDNDSIPLKMLDQPITTNKKYLGENSYRFLMDLDSTYEPLTKKRIVKDERIVKNGFNVVIVFKDDSNDPDINITDIALHISSYGADEFKRLLELMQMQNTSDLHCCRPLKVVNFFRSETVRHCKTVGSPKTKDEINKLLEYWFENETSFSHNSCVHYKTVFTPIHVIDENGKL